MDHAEARELLELAAVEPGGFDRLIAGDTAESAAVAAHLAGCPDCTDEMARLRRASGVIREVVRTTAPPELRARTLAFVGALGRERGGPELAAVPAASTVPVGTTEPEPAVPEPVDLGARRRSRRAGLGWLASIAAAVALSVAGTALVVRGQNDAQLQAQADSLADLATVTLRDLEVEGRPDARRVALTSPSGAMSKGTVVYSASTRELVVVASDLIEPAAPQQLRCWLEVDGQRRSIGPMFFGGGLAYWVGKDVEMLATVKPGSRFGVSLPGGDPILVGEL